MHHLPPELLQYIFLSSLALVDPPKDPCTVRISRHRCQLFPTLPLILTHVCHQWRALALDTPDLWSLLHIKISHLPHVAGAPPSLIKTSSEAIATWLHRSGMRPLTISVHTTVSQPETRGVLETLAIFSERWRSMSFHLPLEEMGVYTGWEGPKTPLLETVEFCDHGNTRLQLHTPIPLGLTFLREAPLRSAMVPVRTRTSLPIQWTHLTSLTFKETFLDDVLTILRQCHNLRVLCYCASPFPPRRLSQENFHILPLPSLIELYTVGNAGVLLTLLSIPNALITRVKNMSEMPPVHFRGH